MVVVCNTEKLLNTDPVSTLLIFPHHNEAANTVISGCASPSCILIKHLNIFHITIKEQGLLLVAPA